ncbi:MAG: hypothetical protein FWH27_09985 [Planctomycetaceae bacterium]|nr:hypothetical protein [Planctomycetaceae bacterium]
MDDEFEMGDDSNCDTSLDTSGDTGSGVDVNLEVDLDSNNDLNGDTSENADDEMDSEVDVGDNRNDEVGNDLNGNGSDEGIPSEEPEQSPEETEQSPEETAQLPEEAEQPPEETELSSEGIEQSSDEKNFSFREMTRGDFVNAGHKIGNVTNEWANDIREGRQTPPSTRQEAIHTGLGIVASGYKDIGMGVYHGTGAVMEGAIEQHGPNSGVQLENMQIHQAINEHPPLNEPLKDNEDYFDENGVMITDEKLRE